MTDAMRAALVATTIDHTIAEQVRGLRLRRGWSKAELARRAGVSWRIIHQLEDPNHDHGHFSIPTLVKVSRALDVALMAQLTAFSKWVASLADPPIPLSFIEESELLRLAAESEAAEQKRESAFPWPMDETKD